MMPNAENNSSLAPLALVRLLLLLENKMKLTLLSAAITLTLVGCSGSPSCDSPEAVKAEVIKHLDRALDTRPNKLRDGFHSSDLETYTELNEFKLSDVLTLDKKGGVTYCRANAQSVPALVIKLPLRDAMKGLSLSELEELEDKLKSASSVKERLDITKEALESQLTSIGFTDVSITEKAIIGKKYTSPVKDIVEYSLRYSDDRKTIHVELTK